MVAGVKGRCKDEIVSASGRTQTDTDVTCHETRDVTVETVLQAKGALFFEFSRDRVLHRLWSFPRARPASSSARCAHF